MAAPNTANTSLRLRTERRVEGWYAEIEGVSGTGSLDGTPEGAIATTLRKFAAIVENHQLDLVREPAWPPPDAEFTGGDLIRLWDRATHPDAGWADDVEHATANQPITSDTSAWDS
ncbi:MAG TPA: hypothetical protein VL463_16825 [Kofleriaceae bacterium]|jgi:hypothetical protein|nr:hypothetical protein [Kofleriaceae bacterium]